MTHTASAATARLALCTANQDTLRHFPVPGSILDMTGTCKYCHCPVVYAYASGMHVWLTDGAPMMASCAGFASLAPLDKHMHLIHVHSTDLESMNHDAGTLATLHGWALKAGPAQRPAWCA